MEVLGVAIHQGSEDFHTMSGKPKGRRAASATPWDDIPETDSTPAQSMVAASHGSMYAFRRRPFEGDAAFFNGRPRSERPFCGGDLRKNGFGRSGMQRHRCVSCNRTSTPVTGAIFDGARLPAPAWADFLPQTFSYASTNLTTREGGRSGTTLPYWMAKLSSVLGGVQGDVVLAGDVRIDGTYVSEAAGKLWHRPDGRLPRGLSRNKVRIGAGADERGRPIYVLEGKGMTTTARARDAFGGRIAPGSHLAHDMEAAHSELIKELDPKSEARDGTALMGAPDELDPLDPVNEMRFLLKSFLRAHSGFDRSGLQGHPDLFHVIANEPFDRMEKAAMVLDGAMAFPKTLRFRDFYNVKSCSERDDA